MQSIPNSHLDLVNKSKITFAFLATVSDMGNPQVSPVWFEYKGDQILINTAAGRTKEKNMRHQNKVCVVIPDPANAYRYIQIFGKVASITEDGAVEHINMLANFYTNKPFRYSSADEKRVIFAIDIQKVLIH